MQATMALGNTKRRHANQNGIKNKQAKEPTFRFLDLPPELQLNIIEYAVTLGQPVSITIGAWTSLSGESSLCLARDRRQPAITYTNRSIRVDALKMYYKNNSFVGTFCSARGNRYGELVVKWLEAIGKDSRRYVHDLTVWDGCCLGDWSDCEWDEELDGCLEDIKAEVESMQGRLSNAMWERVFPTYKITFAKTG